MPSQYVRLDRENYPADGIFMGKIDGVSTLLHITPRKITALSFAAGARQDVVSQSRQWDVKDKVVGFWVTPEYRPNIFFDPESRQTD